MADEPSFPAAIAVGHRHLRTLKARAEESRTTAQRIADSMTAAFGSTPFLILNAVWFAIWIALNSRWIPGVTPFDAFPYGMLTMAVSLEAIFLSIFVLIAQNRSAKVDELRAEDDLQINLIAEQELTKLLQIVAKLAEKQGIDLSADQTLHSMIAPTNLAKIESELKDQIA